MSTAEGQIAGSTAAASVPSSSSTSSSSTSSPILSVILPVYNAAPFLDECFQSLYDQTLQEDFEVSIFDDLYLTLFAAVFSLLIFPSISRSTDSSPAIINAWMTRFKERSNIMVLLSRNDGSGGKARVLRAQRISSIR